MRASSLTAVAVAAVLASSATAMAQQNQGGGLGGALDTLNRAVNPDRDRDERRGREVERSRDDQSSGRGQRQDGVSGSSTRDSRAAPSYRSYSDQDLRDEALRLQDEERQIQRERRAVDDEMDRRGTRR